MWQHLYLKNNFSCSDIYVLIRRIPKPLLMPIRRARLYEHEQLVQGLLGVGAVALVARRGLSLPFASAGIALGLELLDEAGTQPLRLHHDTLPVTLGTDFDVLGVVGTGAAAMRAQCVSCVLYLHLLTLVHIL